MDQDLWLKMKANLWFILASPALLNWIRGFLLLPETSVQMPICFNHFFLPPWLDKFYHDRTQEGFVSVENLYIGRNFASFNQLKGKYNLLHLNLFLYLQVRHYSWSSLLVEHKFCRILKSPWVQMPHFCLGNIKYSSLSVYWRAHFIILSAPVFHWVASDQANLTGTSGPQIPFELRVIRKMCLLSLFVHKHCVWLIAHNHVLQKRILCA